ncbi:MAG: hypothetical protein J6Q89_09200, partial [Clostridia bacterium]|nr:hypothetical protein [Clostridia bacterium]
TVDEYYNSTVAGQTYKTAKVTIKANGAELTQVAAVRKYDGYIIAIMITSPDSFTASSALNSFRTVK